MDEKVYYLLEQDEQIIKLNMKVKKLESTIATLATLLFATLILLVIVVSIYLNLSFLKLYFLLFMVVTITFIPIALKEYDKIKEEDK